MQKKWLQAVPWESVIAVNKALCQAQKLDPITNSRTLDAARRRWEEATSRQLSLKEVLDVCRECQENSPFTFNNGNTFAAIGRTLIEDWTKSLPPVEGQIVQTTVCHYLAGLIGRRELLQVLKHFTDNWKPASTPSTAPEEETSTNRSGAGARSILTPAQPQA